ncbi:hypothetical protein KCU98_g14829, partial [Aureobasidium melanogenum]
SIGVGGIEETRGRAASRQRELDARYDEEMHGTNPFGDDTAERSSIKNTGSGPTVDTTFGASVQKPPHHKNQQSLGAQSADSPSERRSIFREDILPSTACFDPPTPRTIVASTGEQCAVCSKPGKLCASCNNIHYCGAECQKADWKVHKLVCRTFKAVREPPGPNMMRVLVFPFNNTNPEFRWMPIRPTKVRRPETGFLFGVGSRYKKNMPAETDFRSIIQDPKTGERLRHRITIQFREEYKNDGSFPNAAINSLVGSPPALGLAGPVIAYSNVDVKRGQEAHSTDLDTSDLNVIKAWFSHGYYECKDEQFYEERLKKKDNYLNMAGLKECCEAWEAEQRAAGKPVRQWTIEDFCSPASLAEVLAQYNEMHAYKEKWDAKQKAEAKVGTSTAERDFSIPVSREELAWREELDISGRNFNPLNMEEIVECNPWLAGLLKFRSKNRG